jgi:O-methyltransferase domain
MDEMLPPILALNRHIRAHGPNSLLHTYTHTNHSVYYNQPGHTFWEVLNSEPRRINTFMSAISMWSAMHPVVAIYPFAAALAPNNSPDRVLAVDIGGGRGLAMLDLRKNCPDLKGELILQDRPYVLDSISPEDLPGITKMSHDFFTPQPVIGAQMFYIRRVMHDWQDADASLILKSIVPAMAPDSRIIVSDMAIPEMATERDAGAIWLDMMMLSIGGKERTKRDWEVLGEMAGLRLVKFWTEPERYGPLCVVEYMLPEGEKTEGTNGVGLRGDGNGGKGQVQDVGMEAEAAKEDNGTSTTAVETAETEMGWMTPRLEANGATPEPVQRANAMSLDGVADENDATQERHERDEDWEERTVVGDREQSLEPGQGQGAGDAPTDGKLS